MRRTVQCGSAGAYLRTTIRLNRSTVDVSGASALSVEIFRPNGTTVTRTAVLTSDGTDGQIEYQLVAEDTAPSGTPLPGVYRFRFAVADAANGLAGPLDDHQFYAEDPS